MAGRVHVCEAATVAAGDTAAAAAATTSAVGAVGCAYGSGNEGRAQSRAGSTNDHTNDERQ